MNEIYASTFANFGIRLTLARVKFATDGVRVIVPEILDSLPSEDERAIRSRKELHWINALMGNERWILQRLHDHRHLLDKGVVEWGAGEGFLCGKIQKKFSHAHVTAVDLVTKPSHVSNEILWLTGDLLKMPIPEATQVIVANLFLHHLTDDQLRQCMPWFRNASVLIFNEPLRKRTSHLWGAFLRPILEEVTRHDMRVSIDAGFVKSELSVIWSEIKDEWMIQEWEQWPGAYRSVWIRK
jgi:hypothetical protein